MGIILTDEMLDFYGEEYRVHKENGLLDNMTFGEYLDVKMEVANIRMSQLKERVERVKKQKQKQA